MRLSHNILANYVSQIYTSLIGILILPLYLSYMGSEAFGLIGFYTLLQSWFSLLDMGLTPSVARETARLHGGAITVLSYRNLLRALQLIFFVIMIIGLSVLFLSADYLAHSWLKIQTLSIAQVQIAIQLMAFSIALRWMSSLYRAVITGAEQFVWLSGYSVVITTLRYIGVLGVLIFIGTMPVLFFTYQLLIAVFELFLLRNKVFQGLPIEPSSQVLVSSFSSLWQSVKPIVPFALSIAFTSSIWIIVTQTDKLILSKLLSLTEYGYFSLAVIAASGVMMISSPISAALIPRMARLKAEGNEKGMLAVYRHTTRLVAMIVIPVTLLLSLYPEKILWIWTNNLAGPVLRLYALGNALLAFVAFAYYLQYAHGEMKLHIFGNILFICILLPSIICATYYYGMIGAGWVWFLANGLWLVLWVPIVHARFAKGLHWLWLFQDIGWVVCSSGTVGLLIYNMPSFSSTRSSAMFEIITVGILIFLVSCISGKRSKLIFSKQLR